MPTDEMNEDRMDRIVEDLLHGRRLKLGGDDAADRDAVMVAASLAAGREGHPRMSPVLRRRLAALLAGAPESRLLDRRSALAAVAGLAVGAAGALGLGRLAGADPTPDPRPAGILKPAGALGWIAVGLLSDFPEGKATPIVAGAVRAFVLRKGDSLSAVSSICSDLPCSLDWRDGSGSLFCPCHRQEFSAAGVPVAADKAYSVPPLPTFQVKVEAGRVLVLAR